MADDSWLDTLLNGASAALMPSPPTRHIFEDFVATPVDQAHQAWEGTLPAEQYPAAGMGIAGLAALGSAPMGAAGATEGMTVGAGARRAFNPSKLEALNPQNWDLSGIPDVPQGTIGTKVPKKLTPRIADLVGNQDVKDAMLAGIQRGVDMGGHEWYNTTPLLNDFRTVRGAGAGDAAYARYMDLVGATSPRSDVASNLRNASYYFQHLEQGNPPPAVGDPIPPKYGAMAQKLHQLNVQRVEGDGYDPFRNPKPASFAENLKGNFEPVAVDTHAFRGPAIASRDPRFLETRYQPEPGAPIRNIQQEVLSGQLPMEEAAQRGAFWQSQPSEATEYTPLRDYYAQLGQEAGLAPAQAQAAAWTGMGADTGLKSDATQRLMDTLHSVIQRTAKHTGRDPADIYLNFLKSSGDPLRSDLPPGTFLYQGGAPVAPPQPTPYVYDPMGA